MFRKSENFFFFNKRTNKLKVNNFQLKTKQLKNHKNHESTFPVTLSPPFHNSVLLLQKIPPLPGFSRRHFRSASELPSAGQSQSLQAANFRPISSPATIIFLTITSVPFKSSLHTRWAQWTVDIWNQVSPPYLHCAQQQLFMAVVATAAEEQSAKLKAVGQVDHLSEQRVVGPMVECSPATRAIRVRFSDDALRWNNVLIIFYPT